MGEEQNGTQRKEDREDVWTPLDWKLAETEICSERDEPYGAFFIYIIYKIQSPFFLLLSSISSFLCSYIVLQGDAYL